MLLVYRILAFSFLLHLFLLFLLLHLHLLLLLLLLLSYSVLLLAGPVSEGVLPLSSSLPSSWISWVRSR